MKTTLRHIEEWSGHKPQRSQVDRLLRRLLLLLAAIAAMTLLGSCAQTILYRDGQKIAAFQGDMTNLEYVMSADGSVRWKSATVDHSTPTKAQKEGAANIVTQAGIAVAASGLTTLLP